MKGDAFQGRKGGMEMGTGRQPPHEYGGPRR